MNEFEDIPDEMPEEDGIVDHEAIKEIVDKARDALRELGLTLIDEGVQIAIQPGKGMVAMLPCVIRDSAKQKVQEDKEAREDFNKMMASQHEAMIEDKAQGIKDAIADPNKLMDVLFGDGDDSECSHERRHPSGHCLDCGEGLKDE